MKIQQTEIADTFAEAFRMSYARFIVTAQDDHWLRAACDSVCGYATSVIACDAEVGRECWLTPSETPDGRCGARLLLFGFSQEQVAKSLMNRVGQCLMTCPTTAVYDAEPGATTNVAVGKSLRFFGDGFQKSKRIGSRRFWRIPVMDGEFLVEDVVSVHKGIGGGNFLIESSDRDSGLQALRRGTAAIGELPGVMMPFPGGAVRSGSKVGSRYPQLRASTSHLYCPTLRGRIESACHPDCQCVYEIVIDGTDEVAIQQAMKTGIEAAVGSGVLRISAGNYGGKLGKFHFRLHELLTE